MVSAADWGGVWVVIEHMHAGPWETTPCRGPSPGSWSPMGTVLDSGPCPLAEALRPLRPFQPVALFLALRALTPSELSEAQGFCIDGVRCLTRS